MTRIQEQLAQERHSHTSELTAMEEAAGKRLQQAHQELQQANSRVDDLQRERVAAAAAAAEGHDDSSRVLDELRQERYEHV